MEHELKGIRYQSEKYAKLTTLINRVNEESLKEAHQRQKTGKAVGIDGVTKEEYSQKLDENISELIRRMKTFKYIPQAVRRTYIPKPNGKNEAVRHPCLRGQTGTERNGRNIERCIRAEISGLLMGVPTEPRGT